MYDPVPYVVLKRKGPTILVKRRGQSRTFRRNVYHAKIIYDEEDDHFELSNKINDVEEDQQLRRSTRVRRQPRRYDDYIIYVLNKLCYVLVLVLFKRDNVISTLFLFCKVANNI